jgi:hypothetical protein
VYCRDKRFDLKNENERLGFALELYNFSSLLEADSGNADADVEYQLDRLKQKLDNLGEMNGLDSFEHPSKVRYLEQRGLEIVPNHFEGEGGTSEFFTVLVQPRTPNLCLD